MKRLAAALLALLMLTVLTACKSKEDEHINFATLIPTSKPVPSIKRNEFDFMLRDFRQNSTQPSLQLCR